MANLSRSGLLGSKAQTGSTESFLANIGLDPKSVETEANLAGLPPEKAMELLGHLQRQIVPRGQILPGQLQDAANALKQSFRVNLQREAQRYFRQKANELSTFSPEERQQIIAPRLAQLGQKQSQLREQRTAEAAQTARVFGPGFQNQEARLRALGMIEQAATEAGAQVELSQKELKLKEQATQVQTQQQLLAFQEAVKFESTISSIKNQVADFNNQLMGAYINQGIQLGTSIGGAIASGA